MLAEYTEEPGYVVLIPVASVAKITKDTYTLGREARDDIGHELHHFIKRKKNPKIPKKDDMSLNQLIKWELEADIGGKVKRAQSRNVAEATYYIAKERDIPVEEVMAATRKIGRQMNISDTTLDRAEGILRQTGKIKSAKPKTLSEAMADSKSKKWTLGKDETTVKQHRRQKSRGGKTSVRQHRRKLN